MNRKEIIDRLAEHGYTKSAAGIILTDVINVFMEALAEGQEVRLHGFGTFAVRETKEHDIRNLNTGELVTVPSMKVAKFVPGKQLKRAVKEGFVRA